MITFVLADLYLDYWDNKIYQNILDKSKCTDSCDACEGGFSIDKTTHSVIANELIAKKRNTIAYNYQPQCDLRLRKVGDQIMLSMKDSMPWSEYELQKLISAIERNKIIVMKKTIMTCEV